MARKNMTTKAGKKQVTKRIHKKTTTMTQKKKKGKIQADPLFDDPLEA